MEQKTASAPLTVGFARSFAFGIPFWTIAEHGARVRARELGVTLIMRRCTPVAEMAQSLHGLVEQRVDLIIVAAMDPSDPPFLMRSPTPRPPAFRTPSIA